ncbi:MAG: hypothetical protein KAY59_05550 [Acidobacteria bacterium]|nr:hypothetical protein [Acidobacteriota bacterium]
MNAGDTAPPRTWMPNRWLLIIVALLVMAFGVQWYRTRVIAGGAIVLRNATITSSTGMTYAQMTVIVEDGRISYVGSAAETAPAPYGARRLDAQGALVSAATFDPAVKAPVDALRHIWVGQIYLGAPGNLVVTPAPPQGRGRGRTPASRELLGAVVHGRYYSADELKSAR